ncbi:uncharacterized protein [Macrobrachium rosenbergii]|uniref:uncharacterized protein n=1 Tax=Macrobrachium rosenbergii TaxID=79674 RepID=UPI0034D78685
MCGLEAEKRKETKTKGVRKSKWYKLLKDGDKRGEFKKVLKEIDLEIENFQEWWIHIGAVIRKYGKEVLGETSGMVWEEKEGWWWDEDLLRPVREEKKVKKKWEESQLGEDRDRLKEKSIEVKKVVAQAKAGHMMMYIQNWEQGKG